MTPPTSTYLRARRGEMSPEELALSFDPPARLSVAEYDGTRTPWWQIAAYIVIVLAVLVTVLAALWVVST